MKRNIYNSSLKAIAIGMAVAMGSSGAISGVVTGTVVNAYAAGTHDTNVTAAAADGAEVGTVDVTIAQTGSAELKLVQNSEDISEDTEGLEGFSLTGINDGDYPITAKYVHSGTQVVLTIPVDALTGKNITSDVKVVYNAPAEAEKAKLQIDTDGGNDSWADLNLGELALTGSPDVTAPTASSTTYTESDDKLTIAFNEALEALTENTAEANGITVKDANSNLISVTNVTVSGSNLEIILGEKLDQGTVKVYYNGNTLKDEKGNLVAANDSTPLESSGATISASDDKKAPTLVSASVDGDKLTIKVATSENIAEIAQESDNFSFEVQKDGQAVELESVQATDDSKEIQIKAKSELADGNYTIKYLNKDTVKDKSTSANKLANDTTLSFVYDTTKPTVKADEITLDTEGNLVINFNENVTSEGLTATDFEITKNGQPLTETTHYTVADITAPSTSLTIKLVDTTVAYGDEFKVKYKGNGKIKDASNNTLDNTEALAVKVKATLPEEKYNAKNAKIVENSYYQTKEGLLFKGLKDNKLALVGTKEFTAPEEAYSLNGDEATPYLVSMDKGIVTLKSEQSIEGVEVTNATVDKKSVTITTNTSFDTVENFASTKGFKVTKEGEPEALVVDKVSTSDNTITLTLNAEVAEGDVIKFAYEGGNTELTSNGVVVDKISETPVTNETDTTAPTLASGTFTGESNNYTITVKASETLSGTPDKSKFTVEYTPSSSGSENATIGTVTIEGDSLVITTTDKELSTEGATVKVKVASDNGVTDLKGNALAENQEGITVTKEEPAGAVALFAVAQAQVANSDLETTTNETGKVTEIHNVGSATEEQINSMLTSELTLVKSGAFDSATSELKLNFDNVDLAKVTFEKNSFNDKVKFVCNDQTKAESLAKKLKDEAGIEAPIQNDSGTIIVKPGDKDQGNSSSSSSGGGFSGGGAVINAKPNDETTESTTSGNNSNVSEDKDLTLDVISLPSIEGEAKVFGDVDASHWAKSHIDKLSTAGVINGANGMFNPNGQTKRADATIMLVNLLGLTPEANGKFADVNPSAYYAPYVGTASTYGIVNGSNGMFNPEGIISRQDTMVMIAQILKSLDLNVNTDTTTLNQFSDASKVSSYATESVAILINSGIISGNNGKLNPTAPVTRAEMATIMSKLYDVLAEAK